MDYFSHFPKILYDINKNGKPFAVTDILRRIAIRDSIKNTSTLYFDYDMKDSDTVEILAHKIYGSSEYYWVIYLLNEVLNPRYDVFLNPDHFDEYLQNKYPGSVCYFLIPTGNYKKGEIVTFTNEGETLGDLSLSELSEMTFDELSELSGGGVAYVHEWDATLKKLVITDSTVVPTVDNVVTGLTSEATNAITRYFSKNLYAVHHFTTDGDPASTTVNPYLDISGTDKHTIDLDNNYINGYIQDDSEVNVYAVGNYDYEEHLNNVKRKIKILKPEFLGTLNKEIKQLLGA